MNEEVKAIIGLLANDGPLSALLGAYAGKPAVFDSEAPQDLGENIAFVVVQDIANVPWDTHSNIGYEGLYDVRCYAPRTGSMREVREIAKAARRVLHRARPAVDDRDTAWLWVGGGPSPLPFEELVVGQLLTVRMLTQDSLAI